MNGNIAANKTVLESILEWSLNRPNWQRDALRRIFLKGKLTDGIRTALKMSFRQFASRLGITAQSAQEIEEREKNGNISLKSLREVASALNMRLVYGFAPRDGSFEEMLERQALIVARKIVKRTDNTMKLEDQQVSKERVERAVRELADEIKREMPRYLWD